MLFSAPDKMTCYFGQYKYWFFSNLSPFDRGRWIQLADQWVVFVGRGKGCKWQLLDPTQLDEDIGQIVTDNFGDKIQNSNK